MIAELHNLSLIQSFECSATAISFSLHPLVQNWIKFRLDSDARRRNTITIFAILWEHTGATPNMTLHAKQAIVFDLITAVHNAKKYLAKGTSLMKGLLPAHPNCFSKFVKS